MPRRFRPQAIPPATRKPLGPARKWSDSEQERLAEATPKDKRAAADFWRRHSPLLFRNLLDAKPWKGE